MGKQEVIGIIDVGKTNKKLLLFNRQYEVVFEWTDKIPETVDEDGFPCEDVHKLSTSILHLIDKAVSDDRFVICALHFATYGASFVYIDANGIPLTPLYNYLKPYPGSLQKWFYDTYGKEEEIARETASPVLGSLNSGLQVLRVKHEKPEVWKNVKYALHLPQYLGFLFHKKGYTDITSIGCHTQLWNFDKQGYHTWVNAENLVEKFGEIKSCDHVEMITIRDRSIPCGIGLHDSSSALIPYLRSFSEPFVLISTGTWSISMNPFNNEPLTAAELKEDCLCYLQYNGKPVKASRLFMGRIHDESLDTLIAQFGVSADQLSKLDYSEALHSKAIPFTSFTNVDQIDFSACTSAKQAYYVLMILLVKEQIRKLNLVINEAVQSIYVDGGFSKNKIFMTLLSKELPKQRVYASEIAQATALGAALVIHEHWNKNNEIQSFIKLKAY